MTVMCLAIADYIINSINNMNNKNNNNEKNCHAKDYKKYYIFVKLTI